MTSYAKQTFFRYMMRMTIAGIILSIAAYYATRPSDEAIQVNLPTSLTDIYILSSTLEQLPYSHELDVVRDGSFNEEDIASLARELVKIPKDKSQESPSAGSFTTTTHMDVMVDVDGRNLAAWQIGLHFDPSRFIISDIENGKDQEHLSKTLYDPSAIHCGIIMLGNYEKSENSNTGLLHLARITFRGMDKAPAQLGFKLIAACDSQGEPIAPKVNLLEVSE